MRRVSVLAWVFLAILVVAGMGAAVGCTKAAAEITYENPFYGIKMTYPDTWQKVEGTDAQGALVAFVLPESGAARSVRSVVNIIVEDLSTSEPMTLDEYSALSIENVKAIVQDFSLVKSTRTTLAGSPADRIIYTAVITGEQGDTKVKFLQAWTLKGLKAYLVTYLAEEDAFSESLDAVEKVLKSFKIP